jgi:hypothetical protein
LFKSTSTAERTSTPACSNCSGVCANCPPPLCLNGKLVDIGELEPLLQRLESGGLRHEHAPEVIN